MSEKTKSEKIFFPFLSIFAEIRVGRVYIVKLKIKIQKCWSNFQSFRIQFYSKCH